MFESTDDILSVIFLVLVCIVVAAIANKFSSPAMMIPTFSLLAVSMWIALDYIMLKRYKAKEACLQNSMEHNTDEEVNVVDIEDDNDDEPEEDKPKIIEEAKPVKKHKNEFDISIANGESLQDMYQFMGSSADTAIANRMKYMGMQSKLSMDIRARHNVEKLRPYFEEELRANSDRDWWDKESDFLDAFM
jgi:hypothetical protein